MIFKKTAPILLLSFVNTLGFSILIPVLPFIIKQYDASEIVFGFLISAYSAFQFLAAPFLGSLSDYLGRKPVLLITQLGTLLSWVVFGVAYFMDEALLFGVAFSIWVIGLSRITDGITGGNTSVTNAALSDITSGDEKAAAFGYLGAIFGVGMIVGPAIGGITMSGEWGYLGTAVFGVGLSFITLLSLIFMFDESLVQADRSKTFDRNFWHQINLWKKIRKWKDNAVIQTVIQLRVIFGVLLAAYTSILSLYVIDAFGLSETDLAYFLAFVGSFMIFNQAVLVKPIVKKMGEFPTLLMGLGLMASGLIAMTYAEVLWLFLVVYYLTNLGVSLIIPTVMSILTQQVSKSEQGEITGVSEGISAFSLAITPIFAAWLYATVDGQIFMILGSVSALALAWFWYGYRRCTNCG